MILTIDSEGTEFRASTDWLGKSGVGGRTGGNVRWEEEQTDYKGDRSPNKAFLFISLHFYQAGM